MSIRLHIEELVVEGIELGPNGAVELEQAVQARLIQLLHGVLSPGETAPRTFILPSHNVPMVLATSVAESVHAALPGIARGESP